MILKPLYLSAPSRSGSSLLVKMLNCTTNFVVANEPVNSVDIVDKDKIEAIFTSIEDDLRHGFFRQRVDRKGLEVTDTFPPRRTHWGKVSHPFEGTDVIGIKKSFPAFSNKDFFDVFIQEWPIFVDWMIRKMQGGVVVIVRDPRFAILSWKTTFDALRESTENQCGAWNLIADTILSSQNLGVQIVRYEDLVKNPNSVIEVIAGYLGIKTKFKETLPIVEKFDLEDYLIRKNIPIGSAESDFRLVEKLCGEIAQKFGYAKMYT